MQLRLRFGLPLLVFLLGTTLVAQQPQPPKKQAKEEQVDPNPKKGKPVPKVEDDEPPRLADKNGGVRGTDLAGEALRSPNAEARALFSSLAVPRDVVTTNTGINKPVEPVADYVVDAPIRFGQKTLKPIDPAAKPFEAAGNNIRSIEPYERLGLNAVEAFLNKTIRGLDAPEKARERLERLREAETVLAVLVNFHESARARKLRDDSPPWRNLGETLKGRLRAVQLEQVRAYSDARDWDGALALTVRLLQAYPELDSVKKVLAMQLARHVAYALQDKNDNVAVQRLRQLEERFPDDAEVAKRRADLVARVEELQKRGDQETANLLRSIDPSLLRQPGGTDGRPPLPSGFPILYVGVRELPEYLSPATAFTDSERQCVELIFESLLKLTTVQAVGPRYETELADGRQKMIPLGRIFQVNRSAYWSDGKKLLASDVVKTARLLKDPNWLGRSPELADLLHNARLEEDSFHVSLTLNQGYVAPLALMNFKILPPVPSLQRADDERFARSPIGSGPYEYLKLDGKYAVFRANPFYGSRDNKRGLPLIKEIRLSRTDKAAEDFKLNQMQLMLDVPTRLAKELQAQGVTVQTLVNRRIYFLAVNHRKPSLANDEVRQAIHLAINRQEILNGVYRAGDEKVHRPLNGPFPPGTWACPPPDKDLLEDPFNATAAKARFTAASNAGSAPPPLSLLYPEGDPEAKAACEKIKEQLAAALPALTINLSERPVRAVYKEVVENHNYDLAYFHHDYEDLSLRLWPLFDPSATGPGGQNYLGYVNDSELASLFQRAKAVREFVEVQKLMHLIHRHVNEKVPFIPLWQLDSHVAIHKSLQTVPFDPLKVFADVDRWKFGN